MSDTKVPIQARCEVKQLATIAAWMASEGQPTTSRSDLIDTCVGALYEIVLKSGKIDPIKSDGKAFRVLARYGITWPFGSPGHKVLVEGMTAESLAADAEEEQDLDKDTREHLERVQRELEGR